jgi:hypothetical protein
MIWEFLALVDTLVVEDDAVQGIDCGGVGDVTKE